MMVKEDGRRSFVDIFMQLFPDKEKEKRERNGQRKEVYHFLFSKKGEKKHRKNCKTAMFHGTVLYIMVRSHTFKGTGSQNHSCMGLTMIFILGQKPVKLLLIVVVNMQIIFLRTCQSN